jgi:very-short-patch-repair endonuclease
MVTAPTARARNLRNNMTEPEVFLWARLKRLHAEGYHFRRQRPFKGYFLDFVCIDRKLVVELDGGHHNEPRQLEHDGVRDAVLARHGFLVLRFPNSAVRTNVDGVMHTIRMALSERCSTFGRDLTAGEDA